MIGTVEALGVFALAVLPGYAGLRAYAFGHAPLRARGPLGDLGAAVSMSLAGWTLLYLWNGREVLATVLSGDLAVASRIDAFTELVGLGLLAGVALGAAARVCATCLRAYLLRDAPDSLLTALRESGARGMRRRFVGRVAREVRTQALPSGAWDRFITRLSNQRQTVLCRVTTRAGEEVFGVVSRDGYADWDVDGRALLLVPEMTLDDAGKVAPLPNSRGVFIPGDEIAVVRAVRYPADALGLGVDRDG